MNRWTRTALGAALSLAAISSSSAQPQPTLAKMAQSGVIHLSYRDSSVPFSYLSDAKPIGFSIEICDRIVEILKVKIKRPDLKIERQPSPRRTGFRW